MRRLSVDIFASLPNGRFYCSRAPRSDMYCYGSQICWRSKKSVSASRQRRRSSSRKKQSGAISSDKCSSPTSTPDNAIQVFKELRDKNLLTDVTLIANDESRFPTHKALLAACSSYFKAIFIHPFREKDESELRFDNMSSKVLKEILDFAYTREVDINDDNVDDLLEWADYLNIEKLVRLCCDFIIERINVDKCLSLMNTAKHYHYDDLYRKVFAFILLHFEQIVLQSAEFPEMDENDLRELLSNDRLNISNEDVVWQAIQKWFSHDLSKRHQHLPRLIKTVRLALCSPLKLEAIRQNFVISSTEECRQWVGSSYKVAYGYDCHVTDEQMHEMTTHKCWSPRIPAEVILAIGGWSGGSATSCIESYDERADEWFKLPYDDSSGSRAYHGCCVLNESLYIFGGFNGQTYFNSVRHFDLKTKKWRDRAPMNHKRCYISAVLWNGQIWAIGGYDGQRRLKTAERYCLAENQWTLINSLGTLRSDAHAVVLNDHIYMIGGFDGLDCLDSIEYFNSAENRWVNGPLMNNRRSGVGAVVCDNMIYAVGGFNGHSRQKSVERYDCRVGQWENVRSMNVIRSNFGIETIGNKIYVMGGFNGHTTVPSVEIYDIRADRWEMAPSMNVHRSALYCCVLNNFDNMEEFVRMPRHFPTHRLNTFRRRLERMEKTSHLDLQFYGGE